MTDKMFHAERGWLVRIWSKTGISRADKLTGQCHAHLKRHLPKDMIVASSASGHSIRSVFNRANFNVIPINKQANDDVCQWANKIAKCKEWERLPAIYTLELVMKGAKPLNSFRLQDDSIQLPRKLAKCIIDEQPA